MHKPNKVMLAYSGGLDTSVIVPWLKETYGCEVIAFTGNVGQGPDELEGLEAKALNSGASKLIVADLREEFLTDYAFPTLRAGAIYEGLYLLGTSTARPIIAKQMVEAAHEEGADALAHGCTGKGNDQVRFELTFKAIDPTLPVIAPWRLPAWTLTSREDALAYAEERGIPVANTKKSIYSRDRNIWHISHEGGDLEDPWTEPQEDMFCLTVSPEAAPDTPEHVGLDFENGLPIGLDGECLRAVELMETLNVLGGKHGVGREDIVENRLVGNEVTRHTTRPRAEPFSTKRLPVWRRCVSIARLLTTSRLWLRSTRSWSTTGCGSHRCGRRFDTFVASLV